jgi:hypothetical protein
MAGKAATVLSFLQSVQYMEQLLSVLQCLSAIWTLNVSLANQEDTALMKPCLVVYNMMLCARSVLCMPVVVQTFVSVPAASMGTQHQLVDARNVLKEQPAMS